MEHLHALIMGIITGALFGAVLHKVGAIRYSRVEGMLLLRDLKIMKFAFIGVATSSILYGLVDIFGIAEMTHIYPRVMPYMGIAHLIGGFLFGIAMAAAGFCPGTCVARVGAGKFLAVAGVIGLVAGILAYNSIQPMLVEAGILAKKEKLTLYGLLGLPYGVMAVTLGIVFIIFAVIADWLDPAKKYYKEQEPRSFIDMLRGEWHWLPSGILAGLIITWATIQGEYLGFSGAALALVGWIAHMIGHPLQVVPTINETVIWHAGLILGLIPGAFLSAILSRTFKFDVVPPPFAVAVTPIPWVRLALVFFGGFFLALGAMIGGGCTTGSFLAAYPTLSVGSFLMSGTFFVVGILTANLIYFGRWMKFVQAKQLADEVYD